MATTYNDDAYFAGTVKFAGPTAFPANAIGDAQVNPSAPITAPKLEHRFMPRLAQPFGVAAAAERRVVHRARAAGTVTAFWGGLTVANIGAATVTIDLFKNGVTVLAAPVVLTSATPAFGSVTGALGGTVAYAAGDVLEVNVTAAAGGGTLGQGAFGEPVLTEGS